MVVSVVDDVVEVVVVLEDVDVVVVVVTVSFPDTIINASKLSAAD